MAPSVRSLHITTLVFRFITLGFLAASLVVLATARFHVDAFRVGDETISAARDITFKDRYSFRYTFSVAAIGCAYTLLVIPLAAIAAVQGKVIGGTSFVRLLIFTDVVFCALFATGGAAGLGFVVDDQLRLKGDILPAARRFLYLVDASCGLLLAAAICTVVMIMISVYMK
ncbi:hypothetical protein BS78_05G165000 [Paspalum vaginatum]|nr:hypothetical protein BS78_05G165000 [Paspalum vaginatum]